MVSSLRATPPLVSNSKSSQQCATPRGSPPPKAAYGMPDSTMRRARSSASSRRSSSAHAAPGPDSSQQVMQRAPQRLVSCQAMKEALYCVDRAPLHGEQVPSLLRETNVRLGHHLFRNIFQLKDVSATRAYRHLAGFGGRRIVRTSSVHQQSHFNSLIIPPLG